MIRHTINTIENIARFAPVVFLSGLLILGGCRNEASDPAATIDLESLPVSIPEPVLTVDAIDTTLFAFIYLFSKSLDDGSVLLTDVRNSQVYQLNRDGTGRVVADNGRGPGEVETVNNLSLAPDGYLYLYDWTNARMTLFNRDMNYEGQIVVEPSIDEIGVRYLYSTTDPGLFLAVGDEMNYMRNRDPDPVRAIGLYRPEEGSYSDWIRVPRGRLAFTIIDGQVHRLRPVPFMPQTHFAMHPEGHSFFLAEYRYS